MTMIIGVQNLRTPAHATEAHCCQLAHACSPAELISRARYHCSPSLRARSQLTLWWAGCAAIERLSWTGCGSCSPLHTNGNVDDNRPLERVDLHRLWVADRRELVHILIAENHKDNLRLLRHQRRMMDRVGTQQPTAKVPLRNLRIEAQYRMTLLLALAGNLDKLGY